MTFSKSDENSKKFSMFPSNLGTEIRGRRMVPSAEFTVDVFNVVLFKDSRVFSPSKSAI